MKQNRIILYMLALLQGMVFYAPVATLYRQTRGLTISQITLLEGICLLLTLLCEFPWGVAADRIGYRKTMLCCNFFYLISKVVFWKAEGFGAFLLERIILAVVCAGLSGVDSSILYLSCQEGESQKAFSIYRNCGEMGLLLSAGIYSAFLSKKDEWAALATVASYGLAFFFTFFLKEVKEEEKKVQGSLRDMADMWRHLLKRKSLFLLLIAVAFFTEVEHTITTFLNQIQYVKCGMTERQISVVYIVMTVAGLLGIFSERGSKNFGKQRFGRMLLLVGTLCCGALFGTNSALISAGAILLLHICFSLFQPLQLELQNEAVKTGNRATELSINGVLVDALGIGVTVILGAAAEQEFSCAMALGAVLCVSSLVMFCICMKEGKYES